VDEVIVLDDGSTDATGEVAQEAGARVYPVERVLGRPPGRGGQGQRAVEGPLRRRGGPGVLPRRRRAQLLGAFRDPLLEPLLKDPGIGFVKGYYRRPLHGDPRGAGGSPSCSPARCSARCSRTGRDPQPLGGEYAARRELLEVLPFVEGWGVELGLLVDVADRFGVEAIAQRDLGVREHRNRPLDELAPQAMAVLLTGLRRAGVAPVDASSAPGPGAEVRSGLVAAPVRERPPIITVPRTKPSSGGSSARRADTERGAAGLDRRLLDRSRRGRTPRRTARPGR